MTHFLTQLRDRIKDWSIKHAQGKHADTWLAGVSFAESSFFPIPPDVLLIAMLLTSAKRWVYLSFITTVASVFGALAGYVIGVFFFEVIGQPLVDFYGVHAEVDLVRTYFDQNAFLALFLAAFTPIPFKVFTIGGGLFHVDLLWFILGSVLGRGTRFFAIGYMLHRYGRQISAILYRYFNMFSLVIGFFIVVVVLMHTLL